MSELVYNARSIAGETTFKSNDQPPSTVDTTTTTTTTTTTKTTTTTDASSKDDQQHFNMGDKAVVQLLNKLDEGAQTIANLRSILTLKTAELNELIAQLELTNQAIVNVESTTTQIEHMLKDLGLSGERDESVLMHAEASLDSAIKSASHLYKRRPSMASNGSNGGSTPLVMDQDQQQRREQRMSARFSTRIRYKPDTKPILRQLNDLLRDLELDSARFFEEIGTTDDVQKLQKAKVDLDIARTIALSAKSNLKRRTILLRSARRRNAPEEVKMLGNKIRESVALWKTYARGSPLLVDGKDILEILDAEDDLISRNLPVHPARMSFDGYASNKGSPTPSTSSTSRTMRNSLSTRSTDRPTHSRTSSLHAGTPTTPTTTDSSIPIPTSTTDPAAVPPVPPIPAAVKKAYRHSAAARVSVRASTGVPRVRTSSLTGHKTKDGTSANRPSPTARSKDSPTTASSATSGTGIPSLAGSLSPPSSASSSQATADNKKTGSTKPPSQRGPGSTLRIRSMLAKRNMQSTAALSSSPH
ncbi:hypothetical protein RO3G_06352 [Lichtheimia corymbifera JMRC:FSU:9682]|uniref:Uncharacterized protein n=1 Tax=Lichtheimia corymbifera JMRC:FSU:9682 TaxID=1263082 RepID=A0A068RQV7_9FUNG|nr:hypothetical protein RO3G_06352 [Lichtheimia corymbifera JMRC:FSU:9682]